MLRISSALLAALSLCACAANSTSGEVNGVKYRMSLERPAVPGGVPFGIEIRMSSEVVGRGRLWVDGVDFGQVRHGDRIEVTDSAVVLVNGEPRGPREQG